MSVLAWSGDPARVAPAVLVPPALLLVVALFPPETRGEALAGAAGLIALLALLASRAPSPGRLVALVGLLVAALPLAFTAQAPGAAVEPLVLVYLAVALGVYTADLPNRERLVALVTLALAIAGTLVSLHALYQRLWGLELLAERLAAAGVAEQSALLERLREGRAFSAFGTPAALGGYLALALPVTAAAALARRGLARILLLASCALQVGGLAAAASATAVVALGGALALAAWRAPAARARLAAAGLLVATLLGLVMVLRGPAIVDAGAAHSPWRLRAANARLAAAVARDHPWIGVGPGGFAEAYPQYRQPGDNEARHAHDLPLELAAELGLPAGLAIAGLFFFAFLGPLLRTGNALGGAGIAIGLAAFALHNLADFTAFLPSLLWSAVVLRAVAAGRSTSAEPVPLASSAPVVAAVALAGVLLAAALAGLAGLSSNARRGAGEAIAEGEMAVAADRATRATRLAPWSVDGWMLRAQISLRASATAEQDRALLLGSLAHVDRAIRLSPVRPFARHLRSRLRLALGDAPGAYADARMAAALYPLRSEYVQGRKQLGELLRASGAGGRAR